MTRIIIVGKANTISAQLAFIRRLDILPAIKSGGAWDGRAPRAQDADGFATDEVRS